MGVGVRITHTLAAPCSRGPRKTGITPLRGCAILPRTSPSKCQLLCLPRAVPPLTPRSTSLQGSLPKHPFSRTLHNPDLAHQGIQQQTPSDLYVTCQLWADGKEYSLLFRTPHKDFPRGYTWNSVVIFPITYPSLLLSSQIAFTIWDVQGSGKAIPVGGTTMSLFNSKRTLKRGQQRLHVHRGVQADPSLNTTTPSELADEEEDEMGRLERLVKDFERGDIPKIDWLDRLTFRQIEKAHSATEKSDNLYLYVDLPKFDFPVVFSEQESLITLPTQPVVHPPSQNSQPTSALPPNLLSNDPHLWKTYDPEAWRENPVEIKHRKLLRSQRLGDEGRDLKPGPADRDRLNEIFRLPPTASLSAVDKDLLWKFRFSLFRSPRSLTKFLKCITWSDPVEAKQAVEKLLPLWGQEVGMDDALELLGPGFTHKMVRAFAVKRLERAEDDELLLYLLQLVQALKFEHKSSLDTQRGHRGHRKREKELASQDEQSSGLSQFLINRSVANPILGTSFHWYLMIECDNRSSVGKMYAQVAFNFMKKLSEVSQAQRDILRRQGELVQILSTRAKEIRTSKDSRSKKIEKLKAYLSDSKHGLASLPEPLPLPLNPNIFVTSVVAEKSSIFKSNLLPLLIWFETIDSARPTDDDSPDAVVSITPDYPIIFKNGDDLRQDQLVIQLFTLMDRLLRKENLDLRLSPYNVLATSTTEGMIQFVPSKSVASIMAEHGSLQNYLRIEHADDGALGSYGIEASVMDTFVRSCAGYSVLTYVLGVGDRHLDNLMLAPDGHFFHVDFGYILGRDPKPYPPPVKVCKEMVDAMGGPGSAHYGRFQSLCYTAFIGLRKNANLILNLVALMVDAGIQDIQLEPDKAVWKVQEKFMLDLSEEDAIKQFEVLLNDTSYLTAVFDRIHDWAQYLRD
ncbi:phosphatidylinositol 3-kinase [Cryptococcus bacillisporus CA1873]|uniref:Phosphatidylinositol 3-kinase VPS34 n=2 Tax=Cryptococcus gattii TaxID=552467 RepID=A0A0D0VN95_CRYGA|nr:phosphatidylinositol 3-kinase [Cryptococcus bacillisporus CA1280]KIR59973.1 phosphatidylinositol 3-kinase [Cryptococcus bacillisporus CA1873]|eukprot:KIR59973.1 phosphatidylinositol 3-kinase [Cryptococcus gattii CA1873]